MRHQLNNSEIDNSGRDLARVPKAFPGSKKALLLINLKNKLDNDTTPRGASKSKDQVYSKLKTSKSSSKLWQKQVHNRFENFQPLRQSQEYKKIADNIRYNSRFRDRLNSQTTNSAQKQDKRRDSDTVKVSKLQIPTKSNENSVEVVPRLAHVQTK